MPAIRMSKTLPTVAAVALLLLTALPVAAQQPRIPPDARGYQTTTIIQQYNQARAQQAAPSPARPTPTPYRTYGTSVAVDVNVPNVAAPAPAPTQYVTIRGADGEVRRFALARGVEVQYVRRHIVLRPGESTTVRLTPVH